MNDAMEEFSKFSNKTLRRIDEIKKKAQEGVYCCRLHSNRILGDGELRTMDNIKMNLDDLSLSVKKFIRDNTPVPFFVINCNGVLVLQGIACKDQIKKYLYVGEDSGEKIDKFFEEYQANKIVKPIRIGEDRLHIGRDDAISG